MKKILTALIFIFLGDHAFAQNLNFDWVAQTGGFIYDKGNSVSLDASGNVYSTGLFGGTVDFDPGPGQVMLTTINGSGFISKVDKNRNFIWVKQIDGNFIKPLSIKIDASGNVIILGFYYLVIDLDPGPAIVSGSSTNNLFLIKLDAAGNFILGRTFVNSSEPNNRFCLGLDPADNIYITGVYDVSADFDPGPGIYKLPIVGFDDIFILKLDPNANFLWAKGVGSNSLYNDESNAIAVDAIGNVYITGVFGFDCDFDPGPGVFKITSPGVTPYVLKLNANGDFVWAKHFAPITSNSDGVGNGIAVDQIGNVFVGGSFEGGVLDFDPGPGLYPLTSYNNFYDAFLCKLDVSGNLLWAKSAGGSFQDGIDAITLDGSGKVYAVGSFYNTVDFDPGIGINNLTSAGQNDVFILKLNTQGDFEWAKNVGGIGVDQRVSMTVDATGSVYTLGSFEATADMDPNVGVFNLSALGGEDIFLLKLSRCTNSTFHTINASVCNNYILNNQTYISSGTYTQTIPNTDGCDSIITLNLTINRKFTSTNPTICQGQSYFAGGANQTISGIYKDTLQTSLGCDSIVTTNLLIVPKPIPNLGPDRNLCLNGPLPITPGVFSNYLWQDNSTQSNFIISTTGKYWVTVTNANNCTATDTLKVLAIDSVPKNFLPANQLLCYNSILDITVPGYKNYLWSTGAVSNTVSLSNLGVYYLTVTDNNNCIGKDTISLQLNTNCVPVSIPNAFTPNKDGINDIFKPRITQEIQEYSFIVFNRYGQKIFETQKYGIGWDGTFKGVAQPRNSYVYMITFKNRNGVISENKGTVTLVR